MSFENTPEVQWSSFMPALMRAVSASKGTILEIGIGHFSTPVLHEIGIATGREVVSVEQNKDWMDLFATKYGTEKHQFVLGEYDVVLPTLAAVEQFGVVFIDESPGGERRKKSFQTFYPISEYLVVHDYHRENEEAIAPLLKAGDFKVYSAYNPPTLFSKGGI